MGSGGWQHSYFPNGEDEEEVAYHYHANGAATLLILPYYNTMQVR